jgi:hypothetical protein
MKTKTTKPYRIKIDSPLCVGGPSNTSYLVRSATGRVNYMNGSMTPLGLSNLFSGDAAEISFMLEDAFDGNAAAKGVRANLTKRFINNKPLTPTVTVLS